MSPSEYQWERDALDYIRENLPDNESYRAWSNFEFISDNGSINEVDLLVSTPCGFFLIEIKSRPGSLSGDAMNWVWKTDGKITTVDNPLLLANRKAKKLASLLKRQKASQKIRFPFLEPLIFCSAAQLQFHLSGHAGNHICLRDDSSFAAGRGILTALKNGLYPGAQQYRQTVIDRPTVRALTQAMEQAGIRPSQQARRVGSYELEELLYQSPTDTYQDWVATNSQFTATKRRVRIYNIARNTSELDREFLRRAARREFQILEEIDHAGILRVHDFIEHELGPALIFHHYPDAVRLDHFLTLRGESLSLDTRLNLLRQIAETLRYAHEKRLVHRSLSPQSILVTEADGDSPKIKIFNWPAGFRKTNGSTREASRMTPTSHLEQFIEDASMVYLAPEAVNDPDIAGEQLDIFSLGAIAYTLFSNHPPAANGLELREKIRVGNGLRISAVMDGAVMALQELVQYSTFPESSDRWGTVAEFLGQLDKVEEELTEPAPDYIPNPLDAKVNDRLEGGFLVKSRLGKGASATAFVVEKDGREVVLKLANDIDHNDDLRAEAATIRKLRHPSIIEAYEDVEISGLAGFTMQKVEVDTQKKEVQTLTQRLQSDGRLSIDFLQRFGEDLLEAVNHLEQKAVPHRDIKPDNIVVGQVSNSGGLSLVLFDFSLSQTPFDKLRAGTTRYLDPFLPDRKRWDLHAERYAAAVTLYQMATGEVPVWGDGNSDPSLLKCEVTLNDALFDPPLRDALSRFFAKAFRRAAQKRFDNAEEMLRTWRKIFEKVDQAQAVSTDGGDKGKVDLEALLANVTLTTEINALGFTARAENALDRINIITVKDLLSIPQKRLSHMSGVGNKTRREIVSRVNALRLRFPDVEPAKATISPATAESEENESAVAGVDLIAQQITHSKATGKKQDERAILSAFLGLDSSGNVTRGSLEWPGQTDVAQALKLPRTQVGQVITAAREKWRRNPSITALRQTIVELNEAHGGAMTLGELCEAVLNARGSIAPEPRRSQLAAVIIRAAVEAERNNEKPKFIEHRLATGRILITQAAEMAGHAEMAGYVEALARAADELAKLDPIPTPARTLDRLREVPLPPTVPPLTDVRLVKLAVAASTKAALSSRLEIYPKGLAAVRALRLAHGALVGVRNLTVEAIHRSVHSRYPDAEPLPEPPALDDLLREAEIELEWDADARDGKGAYRWRQVAAPGMSSSTASVSSTASSLTDSLHARTSGPIELPPEIADARILDNKLRRASAEGSFLALTVAPDKMRPAEEALLQRFDLDRRNLDELFLRVMREQAARLKVDWQIVLRADSAPRDGQDWRNLMILVSRCAPIIEEELSRSEKTLLLVYPGLLARYGRLDLLERLTLQELTFPATVGRP